MAFPCMPFRQLYNPSAHNVVSAVVEYICRPVLGKCMEYSLPGPEHVRYMVSNVSTVMMHWQAVTAAHQPCNRLGCCCVVRRFTQGFAALDVIGCFNGNPQGGNPEAQSLPQNAPLPARTVGTNSFSLMLSS